MIKVKCDLHSCAHESKGFCKRKTIHLESVDDALQCVHFTWSYTKNLDGRDLTAIGGVKNVSELS